MPSWITCSGRVTRREIMIIMPPVSASARITRPISMANMRVAAARASSACCLARSRATSATPSSEPSFGIDSAAHCWDVMSTFSPATSFASVFARRSAKSGAKNSFFAFSIAAANCGGNGRPAARSSSAPQAVSTRLRNAACRTSASAGSCWPPSTFEISTEESPAALRAIQASCFNSISWSIKGSSSFTSRVNCDDSRSSVVSNAPVSAKNSCARAGRRAAFGCMKAAALSSCNAVSFLSDRSRPATVSCWSGKSIACSRAIAALSAGISAARDSRTLGFIAASGASPIRSRLVSARSTRRLCSAVNRCALASATAAMRVCASSRLQDCHAS